MSEELFIDQPAINFPVKRGFSSRITLKKKTKCNTFKNYLEKLITDNMKSNFLLKIGLLSLILSLSTSCKKKESEEVIIRPVKTMIVGSVKDLTNRTFSGITQEVESVELAFRVSGPLIKLNVTEGEHVKKGQLIAEIDPRDFEIDLQAKEARYKQSKADKERFEAVYNKGSISKSEYEQKLAIYLEARSAYEAAENALADTKLKAPFNAFIDEKLAENFERVQVGQPIVTLFDLSLLEVRFSIPEALAVHFRKFKDFTVTFDLFKGAFFKADLKEIGAKSERSAGIPVILVLRHRNVPNSDQVIVPGMACTVKVNLYEESEETDSEKNQFTVPTSSIYAQPDSDQKFVFLVEEDSMVVSKTEVKLGSLAGENMIWVVNGLNKGDILVTAGAKVLQDGQKVKFLN